MDTAANTIEKKNEITKIFSERSPIQGIVGRVRRLGRKNCLAIGGVLEMRSILLRCVAVVKNDCSRDNVLLCFEDTETHNRDDELCGKLDEVRIITMA